MTVNPGWGLEITELLAGSLRRAHDEHGLPNALRLTPNDTREHERPPHMRSGTYWDNMTTFFDGAAGAGADMLSIESTGGKEICDIGLMNADLRTLVFALGVLAPRDMEHVWDNIVGVCRRDRIVPAGDTACGFANTAFALAEQRMLPRTFAAVVRVASVARSLVAYERGAVGPSKDCAYEGPYMKAIAGVPISMEGRSAACAHLSSVGNISQAVCDCWSNESVQNVRLLSAAAPIVSVEQLVFDCRLLNAASAGGDALRLRDWLTESDAALDPQAYVLRPDIVLQLAGEIVAEHGAYTRTRRAVLSTLDVLRRAHQQGRVRIPANEIKWLDRLSRQADGLPESERKFIAEMQVELCDAPYRPEEYGLPAKQS
jgi:methanol--5-hydroxybenzimidazolylcobamide Co-methyltransferase